MHIYSVRDALFPKCCHKSQIDDHEVIIILNYTYFSHDSEDYTYTSVRVFVCFVDVSAPIDLRLHPLAVPPRFSLCLCERNRLYLYVISLS